MKKILTSTLFLLLTLAAIAGEPFFCITPGRKLYYERYKTGTKNLVQTTDFEIDSLNVLGPDKTQVCYGVTLKKKGKRPLFGGRAALSCIYNKNGDTYMDFGASVKQFVQNVFPHAKIKTSGTDGILPRNMKAGDTLPEAHCVVTVLGVDITIDVTERQVLRTETLTTPAGTFDCVVVRERKVEDAPFHHLDNYLENWYVAGMGYVRHDVYDEKMKPEYTEILLSIR